MEYDQYRSAPCRPAGRAAKPPRIERGGDDQKHAGEAEIGKRGPNNKPRAKQADRCAINGAVSSRQARTVALEQPVAREARNDTPAYYRDQQDRCGQSEAPTESARYGEPQRF